MMNLISNLYVWQAGAAIILVGGLVIAVITSICKSRKIKKISDSAEAYKRKAFDVMEECKVMYKEGKEDLTNKIDTNGDRIINHIDKSFKNTSVVALKAAKLIEESYEKKKGETIAGISISASAPVIEEQVQDINVIPVPETLVEASEEVAEEPVEEIASSEPEDIQHQNVVESSPMVVSDPFDDDSAWENLSRGDNAEEEEGTDPEEAADLVKSGEAAAMEALSKLANDLGIDFPEAAEKIVTPDEAAAITAIMNKNASATAHEPAKAATDSVEEANEDKEAASAALRALDDDLDFEKFNDSAEPEPEKEIVWRCVTLDEWVINPTYREHRFARPKVAHVDILVGVNKLFKRCLSALNIPEDSEDKDLLKAEFKAVNSEFTKELKKLYAEKDGYAIEEISSLLENFKVVY